MARERRGPDGGCSHVLPCRSRPTTLGLNDFDSTMCGTWNGPLHQEFLERSLILTPGRSCTGLADRSNTALPCERRASSEMSRGRTLRAADLMTTGKVPAINAIDCCSVIILHRSSFWRLIWVGITSGAGRDTLTKVVASISMNSCKVRKCIGTWWWELWAMAYARCRVIDEHILRQKSVVIFVLIWRGN